MKCVSIEQPGAWAVLEAGCRVVSWAYNPPEECGRLILLHAARKLTQRDYMGALSTMPDEPLTRLQRAGVRLPTFEQMPLGVIIGRAILVECIRTPDHQRHRVTPGSHGPCQLCNDYPEQQTPGLWTWRDACPKADPWARVGYGLILADVEVIDKPIPFRGASGLFEVPSALLDASTWTPARSP